MASTCKTCRFWHSWEQIGKNGEKWLSISHDALVARIQQARAAIAPFQQEARDAAD